MAAEDDEILKVERPKVGVKTFYEENGVWIDGEFKEEAKFRNKTEVCF